MTHRHMFKMLRPQLLAQVYMLGVIQIFKHKLSMFCFKFWESNTDTFQLV